MRLPKYAPSELLANGEPSQEGLARRARGEEPPVDAQCIDCKERRANCMCRRVQMFAKETQETTGIWCFETFPLYQGKRDRSIAILEEAAELCLISGVSFDEVLSAVKVPMMKAMMRGDTEQEDPRGEAADLLIGLYAYAHSSCFSMQEALNDKMRINRSRPQSYYDEKTKQKQELGMPLGDPFRHSLEEK